MAQERLAARHRWFPLCLFLVTAIAWTGEGPDGKAMAAQGPAGEPLAQRGENLTGQLYCIACHTFPFEKEAEIPPLPAPDLTFLGDKVRPEWLFDFLKKPHALRPWLNARMPSFWLSDEEALALTEYLISLKDKSAPPLAQAFRFTGRVSQDNLKAARVLVSKAYFDCLTCHQQGKKKPEGPREGWAPDLNLASQRLNPDWIIRWLQDPQRIQPGTKMPAYFPGGPPDILGGDDDKQIIALRDYLLRPRKHPAPTPYRKAKAKYPKATPELGQRLVEEMNCVGCHRIAGLPAPTLKIGPDLTHRHNLVTKEWLVGFLRGPEKIRRPGYLGGARRMPNFRLSNEEAEAIAAYLLAAVYPPVEAAASKPAPPPVGKARATGMVTVR